MKHPTKAGEEPPNEWILHSAVILAVQRKVVSRVVGESRPSALRPRVSRLGLRERHPVDSAPWRRDVNLFGIGTYVPGHQATLRCTASQEQRHKRDSSARSGGPAPEALACLCGECMRSV